ncbi:MAG TPA: glycosyltransferase family 1 protein [Rhodospirillaceae bacterium]|nr:glycosyltransferase family 1 protein [Rhodospirillaceae bacterium]
MRKVLYIFDASDTNSRLPVAVGAREKGYDVTIGLIGGSEAVAEGFETILLPKPQGALNPLSILKTIRAVREAIISTRPDILHTVTLKYAFICGLASLFLPHKKIFTLAGLGYLFHGAGPKAALLQMLAAPLLRFILNANNTFLIFQNPDDMALMQAKKFADKDRSFLVRGSGVDLEKFKYIPEAKNDTPVVLMPTRLVHEKGIDIFIAAAHLLNDQGINAAFFIAGGETAHNPRAISAQQMQEMVEGSPVEWLGRVADMPALLVGANLIVYPSHYGEGIPRVLLEACAAGRAIVTTDHTGCREAVRDGDNGILVPVKDPQKTAEVIALLLHDDKKRLSMGRNARARAEAEFDVALIVKKTLEVYDACR